MDDLPRLLGRLRSDRLAFRKLSDDTGVLVVLHGGLVLALNPTATFVIEQIRSGAETLDELAHALATEFEVDEPTARVDIEACLIQILADLEVPSSG